MRTDEVSRCNLASYGQTSRHGVWEGQSSKYSCIIVHRYLKNSVETIIGHLSENLHVRFGLIDCLCCSFDKFVHVKWQTPFSQTHILVITSSIVGTLMTLDSSVWSHIHLPDVYWNNLWEGSIIVCVDSRRSPDTMFRIEKRLYSCYGAWAKIASAVVFAISEGGGLVRRWWDLKSLPLGDGSK